MLKNIASERGIKLGWIAERIEMELTKFSRIANGIQLPDVVEAQKIADVLGVTVAELWPLPPKKEDE